MGVIAFQLPQHEKGSAWLETFHAIAGSRLPLWISSHLFDDVVDLLRSGTGRSSFLILMICQLLTSTKRRTGDTCGCGALITRKKTWWSGPRAFAIRIGRRRFCFSNTRMREPGHDSPHSFSTLPTWLKQKKGAISASLRENAIEMPGNSLEIAATLRVSTIAIKLNCLAGALA